MDVVKTLSVNPNDPDAMIARSGAPNAVIAQRRKGKPQMLASPRKNGLDSPYLRRFGFSRSTFVLILAPETYPKGPNLEKKNNLA